MIPTVPWKLACLVDPANVNYKKRYKVMYGGRNGYKSWSAAIGLIVRAGSSRLRILCTREIQKSISDSVYQLLEDRIRDFGMQGEYDFTKAMIRNKVTGSEFIFDGLRETSIDVKSKEGVDICWVEEAEKVTKKSWDDLTPTIRKAGSEIWITFNTPGEDAETYQRFVLNPPADSVVIKTTYLENPWLTEAQKQEAEECKKRDPIGYRHIWLGEPSSVGGRVYPIFNEDVHVRRFDWKTIGKIGNCYCAIDPHKTAWPAALWGCKVPINQAKTDFIYVIYNEFPTRNMLFGKLYHEVRLEAKCNYTLAQLSGMFRMLDCTVHDQEIKGLTIHGRACDPYFAKGAGGKDWSSNTDGLVVEWRRPENGSMDWSLPEPDVLSTQRNNIVRLLDFNTQMPVTSLNDARLFIMPHCLNVKTALQYHRFSTEKDIEDEKYKDFSDALRILMSIMYYTPYYDPERKNIEAKLMTTAELVKMSMMKCIPGNGVPA